MCSTQTKVYGIEVNLLKITMINGVNHFNFYYHVFLSHFHTHVQQLL